MGHIEELEHRLDTEGGWTGAKLIGGTAPRVVVKHGGAITHAHLKGKPPTSGTLPLINGGTIVNRYGRKVREVGPGLYADMRGRPIIDSTEARDRHAARAGYIVGGD